MSLRTRLALIAAAAVAVALVLASFIAFSRARRELIEEVDRSLVIRAELVAEAPQLTGGFRGEFGGNRSAVNRLLQDPFGRSSRGFDALYVQVVGGEGGVLVPAEQGFALPVDAIDLEIATGRGDRILRTVDLGDGKVRMITEPLPGGALQLARSLDEVESSLGGLGRTLWISGLFGAVVAAGLGLVVSRTALRPVAELTSAAEHVTATQELAARITVDRSDELGRLAISFNAMLDALENSRAQQHRLVRDASHELRTPLTALRTNIEVLARQEDMPLAERRELLGDVTHEVEQLSWLVGELVDLATDTDVDEPVSHVVLRDVAVELAELYQRRSGHTIDVDADDSVVNGRVSRIERAVSNLVDNAVKWSPDNSGIQISVVGGRLSVRDHGPGIDPGDVDRVFDRFYRADSARTMPGSGLGLSIVDQIVTSSGGTTFIEHPSDGGVEVGFELPLADQM